MAAMATRPLDAVGCAVGVAVGGAGVQVGNGSMGITAG